MPYPCFLLVLLLLVSCCLLLLTLLAAAAGGGGWWFCWRMTEPMGQWTGGNGRTDGRTIEEEAAAGGDTEIVRNVCAFASGGAFSAIGNWPLSTGFFLLLGAVVVGRLYIVVGAVVVVFHARTQAEGERRGEVVRWGCREDGGCSVNVGGSLFRYSNRDAETPFPYFLFIFTLLLFAHSYLPLTSDF